MSSIDVSVIVTTRNEERHIAVCLESVRQQAFPQDRLELIVVDNDSSDGTREIAAGFTDLVLQHGPERSAQRNAGIGQAVGTYILYLDADMRLSEGVVAECFRKCEEESLVALYIPERIVGEGFWIEVRDFERSFYNETCIDAVRFVQRVAAQEVEGFDEMLTGPEDWDFDRRIQERGSVGIVRESLYHDEGRFHIRSYLLKKGRYLESLDRYRAKWGSGDPVVRKQLGFWYRYVGVFFAHGKWRRLLRHPFLCFCMYLLRVRVGFASLRPCDNKEQYAHDANDLAGE